MRRFLLINYLALLLAPTAAAQHVQSTGTGFQSASSTTIQLAFSGSVVTGNMIFVSVHSENQDASSCSDNQSNTYTPVAASVTYFDVARARQFYALNVTGGSVTVTCTFAGSAPWRAMVIGEYENATAIAQTNTGTGASGTLTSGNITTTVADALLIGAGDTWDSNTFGAGTNYTIRITSGPIGLEDRIVSATGTYNATMTQTANLNWFIRVVAFELDTGGAPPRRNRSRVIN